MNEPKVLVLDIETSPMLAYIWGRKDQNIGVKQIHSDWSVLAWGAKWLDAPASSLTYRDQRKAAHVADDRAILKPLWGLLDETDIVLTQNGKNFDAPKLNARFILNGMNPPSPYRHIDTYLMARRVAQFTSNSLEYLTDKLCTKYKKLAHAKFPGMTLWKECMAGNLKAWEEMKRYNTHDVLSTEELYNKIKGWAPPGTPNVFNGETPRICKRCGHTRLDPRGWGGTNTYRYRKYQCANRSCGAWAQGKRVPLFETKKQAA